MRVRSIGSWLVLSVCVLSALSAQQIADPDFDTKVKDPAYTGHHPRILFDEAHNNFHTSAGRYKPLAGLLTSDGYEIVPNARKFTAEALQGNDILIIANALGGKRIGDGDGGKPAFSAKECDAVRDWVKAGGSLLLIADHAPFGGAAEIMAGRFGVDMSKGFTMDDKYHRGDNATELVFDRKDGLLGDHPITRGRQPSEQLNHIVTFTGQSLKGPEGSVAILKLSAEAKDQPPLSQAERQAAIAEAVRNSPNGGKDGAQVIRITGTSRVDRAVSAAGRAQGIAFEFGKGRVVVLGEAAVLSAQLMGGDMAKALNLKPEDRKFGMNVPGTDDRQFALNIMHWLSRALN